MKGGSGALLCLQEQRPAPLAGPPISFHVNETTITFPFTEDRAKEVSTSIQTLLQTFAAKQAAERPKKWQSMEYRYKGAVLSSRSYLLQPKCEYSSRGVAGSALIMRSNAFMRLLMLMLKF